MYCTVFSILFFPSFSPIQYIINVRIYLFHFLYFRGLNFVFSSFRNAFVRAEWKMKSKKKILWQICSYAVNPCSQSFQWQICLSVPRRLFYERWWTKINGRIYLSHFLHFQGLNFVFSSFKDAFVNKLHIEETKVTIYQKKKEYIDLW